MIYYIDIDGTICTQQNSGEYYLAEPLEEHISKINELFDNGHTVIYWTARGMSSGIDYRKLTEKQLADWGCRYTELKMSKPSFDVFVDDKSIHPKDFFI